jgi:hypothetical protein
LPAAACSYFADHDEAPQNWCLRADPVHLHADTSGLILFDATACGLDEEQSRALAAATAEVLAREGRQFSAPHAHRWYLTGPEPGGLQTRPLAEVRGRAVADLLPRGAAAAAWLTRINELQMVLHAHPVNEERAARGYPVINSVWLWGGGTIPRDWPAGPFTRVFASDPVIRGIARLQGIDCSAFGTAGDVLEQSRDDDQVLLVLDDCDNAAAYNDFQRWTAAVEAVEREWLTPLLAAVWSGRLARIDVMPMNGRRYTLRPHSRWRVWRRLRPWQQILAAR